jgi:hypothetical protein
VTSTNNDTGHCSVFSSLLLLPPSDVQIFLLRIVFSISPQSLFFPRDEIPSFTPTQNNIYIITYVKKVQISLLYFEWDTNKESKKIRSGSEKGNVKTVPVQSHQCMKFYERCCKARSIYNLITRSRRVVCFEFLQACPWILCPAIYLK